MAASANQGIITNIPESSNSGALYELVARGQKDSYFMRDDPDATWPYDAHYKSTSHFIEERQTIVSLNGTAWGAPFEIEIQPYGDVLTEVSFLINLPSWFPNLPLYANGPTYPPIQANSKYDITDEQGNSYFYTNFVGFLMFEKIQLYQDQFLIQEWTGESLYAMAALGKYDSPRNQKFLEFQGAGQFANFRKIQTTPPQLRIRLPIPGCQGLEDVGLPICGMNSQALRLKCRLRRLEDLVVDLAGNFKPKPWNVSKFEYYDTNGALIQFQPIPLNKIGQPTVLLETIQAYLTPDVRNEIISEPRHILFRQVFENIFTIGELDYAPFDRGAVNVSCVRRLDGRHPTEELFWFFRSQNSIDRNQLTNFNNDPSGTFYESIKLVTAGQDREAYWPSQVWEDVEEAVKHGDDSGLRIGSMNWSLGRLVERSWGTSGPRQPEGTINMTTAYRPDLHINISPTSPSILLGRRNTEMRVYTVGWNTYEIANGRGRLLYAN
ncbi:hypothetical protein EB118_10220 [bacterium]|nr:hypothetical protein [bacterium]